VPISYQDYVERNTDIPHSGCVVDAPAACGNEAQPMPFFENSNPTDPTASSTPNKLLQPRVTAIMPIFSGRTDRRLFVDMIFSITDKYASTAPAAPVEVGDYGCVEPRSGTFVVEGNIYKDDFAKHYGLVIDAPRVCAEEERLVYITRDATNIQVGLSARAYAAIP
jgi:hypothetical protein